MHFAHIINWCMILKFKSSKQINVASCTGWQKEKSGKITRRSAIQFAFVAIAPETNQAQNEITYLSWDRVRILSKHFRLWWSDELQEQYTLWPSRSRKFKPPKTERFHWEPTSKSTESTTNLEKKWKSYSNFIDRAVSCNNKKPTLCMTGCGKNIPKMELD